MKRLLLLFLLCPALLAQDVPAKPDAGERHEFVIAKFKTESGVTLPEAHVVYGTYGHLNAARDNVVLLPSHYMTDFHGYEWLIGTNHALNPGKRSNFIQITNFWLINACIFLQNKTDNSLTLK